MFIDTDTMTIFSANKAMETMLGWSPEELAGMSLFEIYPADARDQIAREFDQHRIGSRQLSSNIPVIRKDGSCIYVDITSNMVTLNGVRCLGGFFRDVTERKQAEETLQKVPVESERVNRLMQGRETAHRGSEAGDQRPARGTGPWASLRERG